MRIGFIGLGIMGRPMAINLLKAGFELTVYNRTASKTRPVVDTGAIAVASPQEIARSSDVIITIVSDTPDVEAVLFGEDGVWQGARANQVVIDMSSISPAATRRYATRLLEKGIEMLDAPVTGGEKGAIEATLAIMVGGKPETFNHCLPILQAMGKTIVHAGPAGSGQMTKLVNQILCAQHIMAMADGLRFARQAGLDLETTLKVVSGGAAGSWMLSNLAPRILQNDFAPGFMLKLQQKDLRLVQEALQERGGDYPATDLAYSLFTRAVEQGLGELGTQGFIKVYDETGR
jgi:3-hydroxyisobutyrate dehydrogenase